MINPVAVDSSNMLNIATKQGATVSIMNTLETAEYICKTELQKYLNGNSKSKRYVTAYLKNCLIIPSYCTAEADVAANQWSCHADTPSSTENCWERCQS